MYDQGLADRIRARGVTVVEVAGWQTRGSYSFNPKGSVNHHTAGAATGAAPSLNICTYGRAGLSGPLCNVLLGRDGKAYVIAAGRANHAGQGNWRGLSGNSSVYGLEIEHTGYGTAKELLDIGVQIHAAFLEGPTMTGDTNLVCQHFEWATPKGRKIDFRDLSPYTADSFRKTIGLALIDSGSAPVPIPPKPAPTPTPKPTPAPSPGTRLLREGMRGPDVKDWQQILVSAGHKISVDGIFGPATKSATMAFQKVLKVTADGIVGPATRLATANLLNYLEALEKDKQKPAEPAPKPTPTPAKPKDSFKEKIMSLPMLSEGAGFKSKNKQHLQAHVRLMQGALIAHGNDVKVDGLFGSGTEKVLKDWQRRTGKLTADGICGPQTWAWLCLVY